MAFWEEKTLSEMNRKEWESLCDHCGKCCLIKLEQEDNQSATTGVQQDERADKAQPVYYTNIVCNLFNMENGHCGDYQNRQQKIPECLRLTRDNLELIEWLPPSCAYRRIMEGRGLPKWHHLLSGDKNSVHESGHSVLGKVVFEKDCQPLCQSRDEEYPYENHIIEWALDDH